MATMLLGFEVWIHHMFATGLPNLALSFFGAASMVISIPSAVAVFAWIATIWLGRPVFKTPFLYFAGFVLLFTIGGVSGVMTAAVPLDWQLNETYFIVAHLHYVLLGINVFPVIGGIHYWFPKFTGRMLGERLGKWSFWVMFIGFNVGFFPMHVAGLLGMPRRIYTYGAEMGWGMVNLVSTLGAFLFAAGILLFLLNVVLSLRRGAVAGANPWGAPTLEWSVPSPPPEYNFAVLPIIESRHPLWEDELDETAARSSLARGYLLAEGRETLGTSALSATPDAILKMPGDSWAPIGLALALLLMCGCMLAHAWTVALLLLGAAGITVVLWLWPSPTLGQRGRSEARHG
jgi:cytochrome c oxidase subunit 1/cytochrome c oxidase subunit I+III